jgi:hypothetical protein
MQNLSTRSKVSSRRFYEGFTFNKRCKSYVHGISMTYQLFVCLQNFMPTLTIALYDLHSFKKLIKKSP